MAYRCFTRTWWRRNPSWPNGREPSPGRKHTIARRVETIADAQRICRAYNETHDPGPLNRKAEFEEL